MTRRADLRLLVAARDGEQCSECGLYLAELRRRYTAAEELDRAAFVKVCIRCERQLTHEEIAEGRGTWPVCPDCRGIRTLREFIPRTNREAAIGDFLEASAFVTGRRCERIAEALRNHGLGRPLWEADHIIPLSEDGPDTLDNMRTLCLDCHGEWTASLAARRARRKAARDACATCRVIGFACAKHGRK